MRRSALICSVFVLLFAFCGLGYAAEVTVSDAAGLRGALSTAQDNGEDDTITLAAGTYTTGGDGAFSYNATDVDEGSLTLTANGEAILDGGGTERVLSIESTYMTDITLNGLTVVSGDYDGEGAGAYVDIRSGKISVRACSFEDNTSTGEGAGLYTDIDTSGSISVTNCNFTGNVVSSVEGSYDGGGLYAYVDNTGDVLVEDCVFTGNSCDSDGGAGYLYSYVGDLTVRRVTASENSASSSGGAFSFEQDYSGVVTIEDSVFTDNTSSSYGGALYFDAETSNTFVCKGNVFTGNEAGSDGGAVCLDGDYTTKALVEDNFFTGNVSSSDGGGAYLEIEYGGALRMVSNDFYQNVASSYGGGAYLYGYDDGPSFLVDQCSFRENRSDNDGGGLYFEADDYAFEILSIENSTFSKNVADGYGGGAYLYGEYGGDVYLVGNDFSENESYYDGGGLYSYVYEGNLYLGESTFHGNVVSSDYGGGGAYLDCEYGDTTVERCAFTNNTCGAEGGGFYLDQEYGDLIFRDNLIANNTSEEDGGGVYLYPEYVRYADIVNNTITANVVTGDYHGGGLNIYCHDDNTVYSISNNIIWGNEASEVPDDLFLDDASYLNYFYVDNNDFSVLSKDFRADSGLYESGNRDEDPLFVSSTDFHLQTGSPVIDMGDSEVRSIGDVDIEGRVRVHGDAVDMGAYEYGSSLAGDGDEGDEDDDTGSSSGGCSTGSFAPALLFLVAPLSLLLRKR